MHFINTALFTLVVTFAAAAPIIDTVEKRQCFLAYNIYLGYCLPNVAGGDNGNGTAPVDAVLDAGASKMIRADLVSEGINAA